ncbi:uncharacterized protein MELLADRAFT_108668 [Melampsora larici-populina 98AG31]|uniref:Uncharacterized protein n=1 Tax=Melampsora larici-populina (strain 98AG31 / pathotype 3-4-7) TaxID=747676 RepID=F4RTV0_MELLP|nr:uncharacterized protein MELLADRAFT_108668 [Melampsora larici-populina 98AG31]EGG04194.1 hypothetical protein MELLADRAFT_108668 [Melampsora larici-populina 98AG31]
MFLQSKERPDAHRGEVHQQAAPFKTWTVLHYAPTAFYDPERKGLGLEKLYDLKTHHTEGLTEGLTNGAQQLDANKWVKRSIPVESFRKASDFVRDDAGGSKDVDEIERSMSLPGSSADTRSMMGPKIFDGPSSDVPDMKPGGRDIYEHAPSTSTAGSSESSITHIKAEPTIGELVTDHPEASKYDPNLDPADWYQKGLMSTFGIDGSYQGVYTRALAEIFDVMGDKNTWSLERSYKSWRVLSSLQKFDKVQFSKSQSLITKYLTPDEAGHRYELLKKGYGEFHSWISAFFQHQALGTKSESISSEAYQKISNYKPGEALLIHNYLEKNFGPSSLAAIQHLQGRLRRQNVASLLKSKKEVLEIEHVQEALNLAVEKGNEASSHEIIDALSAQARFSELRSLPRGFNQDVIEKIKSNTNKLEAMLPQWLSYKRPVSWAALPLMNDEYANRVRGFSQELHNVSPSTWEDMQSSAFGAALSKVEEDIKHFDLGNELQKREREIDEAAKIVSGVGFVGEEHLLAWITIQQAKNEHWRVKSSVQGWEAGIYHAGNYVTQTQIQHIEKLIEHDCYKAFGLHSLKTFDKYDHPSFDQVAKLQETMKIVKSVKPKLIDNAIFKISRQLGPEMFDIKSKAIKRAEVHTMLVNRWKEHQEVLLRRFFASPENGHEVLNMFRFGSFLKLHEVFPTFSTSKDVDRNEMLSSYAALSPKHLDELENLLGRSPIEGEESRGPNDYIKQAGRRLKFATSKDGQLLKKWKNNEPKSWLYYGMNFEMLTEFTKYLKVDGAGRAKLSTLDIPAEKLVDWQGSIEEEWMNEAVAKISRGEGPYKIKPLPLPMPKIQKFNLLHINTKAPIVVSNEDKIGLTSTFLSRSKTDLGLGKLSSWKSWKKGSNLSDKKVNSDEGSSSRRPLLKDDSGDEI